MRLPASRPHHRRHDSGKRIGPRRRREPQMVDAGRRLVRPVHDHARQHGRERRVPSIRADLGISISELEWVVNAYALDVRRPLLSGGKLADLLVRRAIFIAGLRSSRAPRSGAGWPTGRRTLTPPARAGRRGRADEPGVALDPHRHVPARGARDADGIWAGGPSLAPRSVRWSAACSRAGELELDLLHQRAGRRPGVLAARPSSTGPGTPPRTALGPAGARAVRGRSLRSVPTRSSRRTRMRGAPPGDRRCLPSPASR